MSYPLTSRLPSTTVRRNGRGNHAVVWFHHAPRQSPALGYPGLVRWKLSSLTDASVATCCIAPAVGPRETRCAGMHCLSVSCATALWRPPTHNTSPERGIYFCLNWPFWISLVTAASHREVASQS